MGSDRITILLIHSLNLPHLTVHGAALYHTLKRLYKMKVFHSEYNYKLSEVLIAIVAARWSGESRKNALRVLCAVFIRKRKSIFNLNSFIYVYGLTVLSFYRIVIVIVPSQKGIQIRGIVLNK